jgi:hypothetical protein
MPRITNYLAPDGRSHFWTHYNNWLEFLAAAQLSPKWGNESWGSNLKKALDLARYGWPEGRKQLKRLEEKLNLKEIWAPNMKYAHTYDVGGSMPDVPLFLTGAPDHMVDLGDQHIAAAPIVRFQINIDSPGFISDTNMQNQAVAVCSLIDTLESQGYQCEVRLANATYAGASLKGYNGEGGDTLTMYTCAFKNAGEALDQDMAVFALGHPDVLREFLFSIYKSDLDVGKRFRRTMGTPTSSIPSDYTDPGAINIPPADRQCTSPEKALKRLIGICKGEAPDVDWSCLDIILAMLEAIIAEEVHGKTIWN